MSTVEKLRGTGCPIAYGLDIFGDRWSLLIIRDLLLHQKQTYGAFLDSDEAISTNILADRLKQLEAAGIVERRQDPDNRRSFIYSLTQKGRDLAPVLIEMIRWGGRYDSRPNARKGTYAAIESDRKGFEDSL